MVGIPSSIQSFKSTTLLRSSILYPPTLSFPPSSFLTYRVTFTPSSALLIHQTIIVIPIVVNFLSTLVKIYDIMRFTCNVGQERERGAGARAEDRGQRETLVKRITCRKCTRLLSIRLLRLLRRRILSNRSKQQQQQQINIAFPLSLFSSLFLSLFIYLFSFSIRSLR